MERIHVSTRSPQCLEDITAQVSDVVRRSGVEEGICHLFVTHTTAGLVINENADPDVVRDLLQKLEALAPSDAPYHHHKTVGSFCYPILHEMNIMKKLRHEEKIFRRISRHR